MTLNRHGRACPGHPEMLCTAYRDARHIGERSGAALRTAVAGHDADINAKGGELR
jgi:hypothetical protein